MTKKKKSNINKKLSSLILFIIISIYGIYSDQLQETFGMLNPSSNEVESELKVYFLDVGQADAILIQNNNENMLIDAGNNEDGKPLVEYFKSLGINTFKYIVATHPHEDHIGGLDNIINEFQIKTIYMPDAITTTKTFTEVLDAIENKSLTYNVPKINETFSLGEATFKVIYTGTDTSDLNNTSIILKLEFGNTTFLLTGDATSETEKLILKQDIKADVLKLGHHGSRYSSSNKFLDRVSPKQAIISVGKDNSYEHPHKEVINSLKKRNIEIYRTDELGSILVTSDGYVLDIKNIKTDTNG